MLSLYIFMIMGISFLSRRSIMNDDDDDDDKGAVACR